MMMYLCILVMLRVSNNDSFDTTYLLKDERADMQDSINGAKGIVLIYFAGEASPKEFGDTRKRRRR